MPAATTFTLTLTGNYHRAPVKLAYTEAATGWTANTVTVTGQYRANQQWFEMHDFLKDGPGNATYWSSIFGLQEGTAYPVSVRWLRKSSHDNSILEDLITTGSVTTLTSPRSGSGDAVYVHPDGDDTSGDGSYDDPYKTIVKAATVIGAGGHIVLKNGTYSRDDYTFGNTGQWQISNMDGTSGAYKTVRPETPGGATISGKKLLTGLTWTQHGSFTNIWWAPFTNAADFIDTDATPDLAPIFIRNELTGNILWLYDLLAPTISISLVEANGGELYTITTSANHGFATDGSDSGRAICVTGIVGSGNMQADLNVMGLVIATVPNTTQFVVTALSGSATGTYTSGGQITPSTAPAMEHDTLDIEGFAIDWTNERIYIRQKAARAGTAPASGEYSASFYSWAMRFVNCSYLIIEDLIFDMFGGVAREGSTQYGIDNDDGMTAGGLGIFTTSDDVVVRRCTFNRCVMTVELDCDRVTIEDNIFTQQNHAAHLLSTPFDRWYKNRIYSQNTNECYDIDLSNNAGQQTIVRRNTFAGTHWCMVCLTQLAYNNNSDFYENVASNLTGDMFRFDSSGTPGNMQNSAIWHNTATDVLSFIDCSTIFSGPCWVIGNKVIRYYEFPIQHGDNPSAGWLLAYNNTFWSDRVLSGPYTDNSDGPMLWFSSSSFTSNVVNRYRAINNLYASTVDRYLSHGSSGAVTSPGVIIQTNSFYTTDPSPVWTWHNTDYATQAALTNHLAGHDVVTLSGNLYATNPFPDGITGDIAAPLKRVATRIKGISMIAADANGNRIGEPGHIGCFENFRHPNTPDTTTEAPSEVLGLRWPNHWRQSQLA